VPLIARGSLIEEVGGGEKTKGTWLTQIRLKMTSKTEKMVVVMV